MMIDAMSRRDFIALVAVTFADILRAPGYAARFSDRSVAEDRLGQIFSHDLQSAWVIGDAYLRAAPEESNPSVLADMIVQGSPALLLRLDALSKKDLIVTLKTIIRQDFVSDKTVKLNGWVLSKTEARLCALCTLCNDHVN